MTSRAANVTAGRALPGVLACLAVAGYLAAFGWALGHRTYDVWGAMIVAPVLVVVTVPLLLRLGRADPDPRIARLLVAAFLLKLAASLARYWMAFGLYGGGADSARYSLDGARVADQLQRGILSVDLGVPLVGTGFVVLLTGIVYAVVQPTVIGGFLVFGWMSFWGQYLFYRAFRVGFPDGDAWRYALLVFLLPSILFWPSSIGKDAWMLLALGASAYGVALLLARRRGALVWLAAGTAGTLVVRPHVTLLLYAGLAVGVLVRRRPERLTAFGPVKAVVMLGALAVTLMFVLRFASSFLGTGDLTPGNIDETVSFTEERTSGAGSDYQIPPFSSPWRLPVGIITVLFRPFPFEAHNPQSLVASLEGLLLLGIVAVAVPRVRAALRSLRRNPYVGFVLVYALLFSVAFSAFANFGILTRERVQAFPFVIVLLAGPRPVRPIGRRPPVVRPTALARQLTRGLPR